MPDSRICLFFSDSGRGHRSATEAIKAGIEEILGGDATAEPVEVVMENVVEKSHPLNRSFVQLYNYLLRHHQSKVKYYYWILEALKPNDSPIGYWLARSYTKRLILDNRPSVIVSVHPMINHYLAQAREELGLTSKVKMITVITDPNQNLWTGWGCTAVDLTIAPNDLARQKLISWGISPERIRVMGMPVHPSFLRPPSVPREKYLTELGLDPKLLTICLNAGWAGGGNMLQIYRALGGVKRPCQIIFGCGKHENLFKLATMESKNLPMKTAVLPFHKSMADLMSACDLMVTKAGGITTFEALARRLPIALDLITEPMPQESGTVELLIAQHLAQAIRRPVDIVALVESLPAANVRPTEPLPAVHSLDKVGAVYDIARALIAALSPAFDQLVEGSGAPALDRSHPAGWDGSGRLSLEEPAL